MALMMDPSPEEYSSFEHVLPDNNKADEYFLDRIKKYFDENDNVFYSKFKNVDMYCIGYRNPSNDKFGIFIIDVVGFKKEGFTGKLENSYIEYKGKKYLSPVKYVQECAHVIEAFFRDNANKTNLDNNLPWIFRIICYPFMTKQDYYDCHLDRINK